MSVLVGRCARMCEDVGVLIVQDDRHWPQIVDESARNLPLPHQSINDSSGFHPYS